MEVRLLTRNINSKERLVLTLRVDSMRFLGAGIAKPYSHRWEIELGYREMKRACSSTDVTLPAKRWWEYGKRSEGGWCI